MKMCEHERFASFLGEGWGRVGAPWWYPELDKMREICESNFKKVER